MGTEGILLGLLHLKTGVVNELFTCLGISLKAAQKEVKKIVGGGVNLTSMSLEMPITPRAQGVLERARDMISQLEPSYVRPEHLLFSLMQEKEGVAFRVLENLRIDLKELENGLLELFKTI